MDLIEMGNKIKQKRRLKRLTQGDLADIVGYSDRSIISRIEKGQVDISQSKIEAIAKALSVSPLWLIGNDESKYIPMDSPIIELEVIGSVKAGYGSECLCEYTGDKIAVPVSIIQKYRRDEIFALQVKSDSMYPKILNGDIVICHKCDYISSSHKIGIILNLETNESTIKQVIMSDNSISLIPLNSNYPPKTFVGNEMNSLKIIGEVITMIREF